MECPRCTPGGDQGGPYRQGASTHLRALTLVHERHAAGVEIHRCASCGGTFLDHGDLQRIEAHAREHRTVATSDVLEAATRRAYAHARSREGRAALACPGCQEEMAEREWGFGSQVRVDVCIECQGVWLDGGELEDLEDFAARRRG